MPKDGVMHRQFVPIIVGLIALGAAEGALAADLPDWGAAPPEPVVEFASNWYVRGDAGWGFPRGSGGSVFGAPFTSTSVQDVATVGAGFGYRQGWFRADATVDYGMNMRFTGTSGSSVVTSDLSNLTTLFNGYVDLGTWARFTPYVGAGVGVTVFRAGAVSDTSPVTGGLPSTTNSTFAWDATAGVSYFLSRNWLIDLNYRYLDMGVPQSNIPGVGTIKFGDITANQVRLGFRYQIN
jgi:opacity protein-like surface antigen